MLGRVGQLLKKMSRLLAFPLLRCSVRKELTSGKCQLVNNGHPFVFMYPSSSLSTELDLPSWDKYL